MTLPFLVQASYLVVAVLFIMGLKGMSSPRTAQRGIVQAGFGMAIAVLATFALPGMRNLPLIVAALLVGGIVSGLLGGKIAMTAMPQGVAAYNGLGGGAAAAIAALELAKGSATAAGAVFSALGALIGCVSLAGSAIAFAKLQGAMRKPFRLPAHNVILAILALGDLALAFAVARLGLRWAIGPFLGLAILLGALATLPVGGADMPVVISLLNALTGLAVGLEGYALDNPAMIVAGVVVGASGLLLTRLMAKAMNRKLASVLFKPFSAPTGAAAACVDGAKEASALDAAAILRYASSVIIVPGYGMAVAGAQHKVWEMAKLLRELGVEVKFAIHPVAGRMPGHMNVLLAEAGVPYELILDIEEVNGEFERTDVALIIGANDVVNPAARNDPSSPIYGMPILNADKARSVIVNKRGNGTGYSGAPNELFCAENARLLYGSAQTAIAEVIADIRALG
jgi:NAD(P) transhydrogenase subunit beta